MIKLPLPAGPMGTPPTEYTRLRATAPVTRAHLPDGTPVWLITRYEEVVTVLSDPRFSRHQAARLPGVGYGRSRDTGLLNLDPPEHSRIRSLVSHAFTPRRLDAWRPRIQQITDELITDLRAGPRPRDLVEAFASPLAMRSICEIMGIPASQWRRAGAWIEQTISQTKYTEAEVVAARRELDEYLEALIEAKRTKQGDDLTSALIAARDDHDRLRTAELTATVSALLVAGLEGSRNIIARHLFALLAHPQELDQLRQQPALLPEAVEELLRYAPSSNEGVLRVALQDLELAEVKIHEGDVLLPVIVAATWDPLVFPEPSALDLDRRARRHIAFGHGRHYCVAAPLVRLQLAIGLGSLIQRLPTMALATPATEVRHKTDLLLLGVEEVPVTW